MPDVKHFILKWKRSVASLAQPWKARDPILDGINQWGSVWGAGGCRPGRKFLEGAKFQETKLT